MSHPHQSKSFPYWILAMPFGVILFGSFAMDAMDIDESIVIPTLVMSIFSLLIIHLIRKRQGRRSIQRGGWGWFFAGPVLLLLVMSLVEELSIDEGFYIPAVFCTCLAAIYVFTKRTDEEEEIGFDEADVDARVERLVAARLAEARATDRSSSPSWLWTLMLAAGTAVGTFFLIDFLAQDEPMYDDTPSRVAYLDDQLGTTRWQSMVAETERAAREAEREVQRAARAAQRRADEIARLELQEKTAQIQEQERALKEEHLKNQLKLVQAEDQVMQSKKATQDRLRQTIRNVIRGTIQGSHEVDIEDVKFDAEDGIEIKIVHNDQPMTAKLNTEGCVVTKNGDVVVTIDESGLQTECDESDDCELTADHQVKAEADAEDWSGDGQSQDWDEIAGALHEAIFVESGQVAQKQSADQSVSFTFESRSKKKDRLLAQWSKDQDKEKPAWVFDLNQPEGDAHRIVAITGPCESQKECLAERDKQIALAVTEYATGVVDGRVNISKRRLREFVVDEYYGRHESGMEDTKDWPVIYTLLEVDGKFRDDLVTKHRQQKVTASRMAQTGVGSFGILGVLGSIFGYLKLDERSAGQKRGRLKLGATTLGTLAVILASVAMSLIPSLIR
jgi:hypothetical protein